MAEKEKAKGGKKGEPMTQDKIVSTFQKLRQEQRAIVGKITELEGEHNEYKCVTLFSARPRVSVVFLLIAYVPYAIGMPYRSAVPLVFRFVSAASSRFKSCPCATNKLFRVYCCSICYNV